MSGYGAASRQESGTLFDPDPDVPPHQRVGSITEARRLRDEGQRKASDNSTTWVHRAYAWIAALPYGTEFDADTLRAAIGNPRRMNAMGAMFRFAADEGLIRRVGFSEGSRVEQRGRVISRWRREDD